VVDEQPVPSYEELAVLVVALQGQLAVAQEKIAELEAQLARNSKNSSKPPSSDGLAKPAPKSLRRKTGRKPGGQSGHRGSTLRQTATPDEVVRHEPRACSCCGAGVAAGVVAGIEKRQQFDIPPIAVRVTEHQLVSRRCTDCGTVTKAGAPEGVDAPVQYGPGVAAVIVYLYVGQFLSKARTASALAELFGIDVSAGTVASVTRRAAGGLNRFLEQVRIRLCEAEVAHFDETGLRVQGRLRWVHSASSGKYVLITVHNRRGVDAMNAAGVLPGFTGVAVHDAWAPYDTYTAAQHALCNAHLLRELQAVCDTSGCTEQTRTAGGWCWACQGADALLEIKKLIDDATRVTSDLAAAEGAELDKQVHHFRSAAILGGEQAAAQTGKLASKHAALARRMLHRQADYLRFTRHPAVPFDNNAAEREIRMVKLRQKVSGCLRTLTGAQQFAAIRSYLATAAKHGLGFYEALRRLAEGNPWMPAHA
jgi:transposase